MVHAKNERCHSVRRGTREEIANIERFAQFGAPAGNRCR